LIHDPFTPQARLDTDRLVTIASTSVRLLDNVLDSTRFPLPQQQLAVQKARRLGLGITGLADALLMLGIRYGSDASLDFASGTMRTICHAAYRQSIAIAREKHTFPAFDRDRYLAAPFIQALPADIRDGIARQGIRNSHLLAIAPTGTISLLAGNVSSGIEPVFAPDYLRAVLKANATSTQFPLTDYAVRLWRQQHDRTDGVPDGVSTATDLPLEAHLAMQAALQPFVDNSISKTINMPAETSFSDFAKVYRLAYDEGLKGCTTFRPTTERRVVLAREQQPVPTSCRAGECE
jgi:ribonucleoside-diphosphate reductase alpha chain